MIPPEHKTGSSHERLLMRRTYWIMRLAIAAVWIWTAIVSWWFFPQAESLQWLQRSGITAHTQAVLAAACLLDFGLGIASAVWASRHLWWLQIVVVASYTAVIAFCLPEFLFHPFGPLSKNLPFIACLYWLAQTEPRH